MSFDTRVICFRALLSCCGLVGCIFQVLVVIFSSVVQGVPFRTSHDIVGKAVAIAVGKRVELQNLSLEEFRKINPVFEEDVYTFLGVENSIAKFRSYGSTGGEPVAEQMKFWMDKLAM
jgi:argininosuccinate lyase